MARVSLWLVLSTLTFNLACSRPANIDTSRQSNARSGPEAELKLVTPTSYPSSSTQSVLVTAARLDESKGVVASAGGGCSAASTPEKNGTGTYKISVTIPSRPEDGTCSVRLVSSADGGSGSVNISYTADPGYWKKAAPAMYSFANSKTWTFHSGENMKVFHLLQASPTSGNKLAVLLVGDKDARSGMSVGADNSVMGEFDGCVLEGKFAGSMATLKPMMAGDSCKGVTTVTLMVSN